MYTYIHSFIHTYIHTYIYTHIYTYDIHIYTHIYTSIRIHKLCTACNTHVHAQASLTHSYPCP